MALPNVPHQIGRVTRLTKDYTTKDCTTKDYSKVQIVAVDARHDVPDQAPDALIAHVRKLTGTI
jgi:hypothetical protein